MTVNGKRKHFVPDDLREVARQIARLDPQPVLEQVIAGVEPQQIEAIRRSHRLFH